MMQTDAEDRFQILANSSLSLSGARVLKHGETFAVFDRYGDIRPFGLVGAQGVYHEGTRHLSALRLLLGNERPLLLCSTVRRDNILLAVELMSTDLAAGKSSIAHGTLHVSRAKFLWRGSCYERVRISNYGMSAIDVELAFEFDADFADVFEVRGTTRAKRGELQQPQISSGAALLSYRGIDGVSRRTRLAFSPVQNRSDNGRVGFDVHLESKQTQDFYVSVTCESGDVAQAALPPFEHAYSEACAALSGSAVRDCRVTTSNEQFNRWLERSISDLRMMITETPHGPFPYAGVPWFSTPFGRDALITALAALWMAPELCAGVLNFLAATQATERDPSADAEPGKILHEQRMGEMASLREIPFGRYYGSVDSTPLFIMLAAAYHDQTGDTATIEKLWPNIERALLWIDEYGDRDGDGFVEYGRHSADGLVHQGWKDSHDAIFHADGTLAEGPIALCEVQGYVYAAREGAARLAALLGHSAMADTMAREAQALRARFDAAFWCEDLGMYALALDGTKRPCRVRTSNAGQCLFTGIVLPERAKRLADQLMSEAMFSGWGVRTVAATEHRYNPLSYHNGSIWPHDNALIAWGLARYGFKDQALQVMSALFDASLYMDMYRLPELFCGSPRQSGEGPTLYPVACAPQVWAAVTPLLLLRAALGMSIDGANSRVRFDEPILPRFVKQVRLKGLSVRKDRVDLALHRHPEDVGVRVTSRTDRLEVVVVK